MTNQPKVQHGGPRTAGKGKKIGPPYRDKKLRVIKVQCTEEEFQAILKLNTRQRTEILLRAINE